MLRSDIRCDIRGYLLFVSLYHEGLAHHRHMDFTKQWILIVSVHHQQILSIINVKQLETDAINYHGRDGRVLGRLFAS